MVDVVQANIDGRTRSSPALLKLSYHAIGPLFASGDALMVLSGSVLGGAAYQWTINPEILSPYAAIGIVTCLAYQFIAWGVGLYRVGTLLEPRRDYGQILMAWLL